MSATVQLILEQTPDIYLACEREDLSLQVSPFYTIFSDETIPTESYTYPFANTSFFTVSALTHGLQKVSNTTILDSDNYEMTATVLIDEDFNVSIQFSKPYSGKVIIS